MTKYWVLGWCVVLSLGACAHREVRCDGHLQAINVVSRSVP